MNFSEVESRMGLIRRTYSDGDGIWTDHTGFYLNADGIIFRRHLDGHSGECTEREVTEAQFWEEVEEARGEAGCSVSLPN